MKVFNVPIVPASPVYGALPVDHLAQPCWGHADRQFRLAGRHGQGVKCAAHDRARVHRLPLALSEGVGSALQTKWPCKVSN